MRVPKKTYGRGWRLYGGGGRKRPPTLPTKGPGYARRSTTRFHLLCKTWARLVGRPRQTRRQHRGRVPQPTGTRIRLKSFGLILSAAKLGVSLEAMKADEFVDTGLMPALPPSTDPCDPEEPPQKRVGRRIRQMPEDSARPSSLSADLQRPVLARGPITWFTPARCLEDYLGWSGRATGETERDSLYVHQVDHARKTKAAT